MITSRRPASESSLVLPLRRSEPALTSSPAISDPAGCKARGARVPKLWVAAARNSAAMVNSLRGVPPPTHPPASLDGYVPARPPLPPSRPSRPFDPAVDFTLQASQHARGKPPTPAIILTIPPPAAGPGSVSQRPSRRHETADQIRTPRDSSLLYPERGLVEKTMGVWVPAGEHERRKPARRECEREEGEAGEGGEDRYEDKGGVKRNKSARRREIAPRFLVGGWRKIWTMVKSW